MGPGRRGAEVSCGLEGAITADTTGVNRADRAEQADEADGVGPMGRIGLMESQNPPHWPHSSYTISPISHIIPISPKPHQANCRYNRPDRVSPGNSPPALRWSQHEEPVVGVDHRGWIGRKIGRGNRLRDGISLKVVRSAGGEPGDERADAGFKAFGQFRTRSRRDVLKNAEDVVAVLERVIAPTGVSALGIWLQLSLIRAPEAGAQEETLLPPNSSHTPARRADRLRRTRRR